MGCRVHCRYGDRAHMTRMASIGAIACGKTSMWIRSNSCDCRLPSPAFGQIAYKRLMDSRKIESDRSVFLLTYGGAVIITGFFALATTDFHTLSVQPHQWLALIYLGVIASGLCFFLWNLGARKVNDGALAVMNNLKIPVGVIASLAILKESTDYPRLILGCCLFVLALWINRKI